MCPWFRQAAVNALVQATGPGSACIAKPGTKLREAREASANFALKTGEPEACESKHARTPAKEYATIDTVFLWREGLGS